MNNTVMKRDNGHTPASLSGLVDQIFENNLNRFFRDDFFGSSGLQNASVPVNLQETDNTFVMEVVAPGLKKEDFKLNVNNDVLMVGFDHKEREQQESKDEGWLRKEYRKRSFMRSFNLDDSIDAGKISAKYLDGILYVTLPKKEGAQRISRSIQIS
ncbi:MAG TPA: Hsp20/alpha crystallin family protein [Flavipsychrobacter sp.]|nr:Hsp20/alpha crystallin family protein [Flavipsychrobacter sp.]